MALPDGIVSRSTLRANGDQAREDFADVIYNISPTDTPGQSNFDRTDATNDYHEWPIDELVDAVSNNAHVDGDDFVAEGGSGQVGGASAGTAGSAGYRIGNFCQISRKDVVVSRRSNKVRKAGRRSELNNQMAKRSKELKRDIEKSIFENQAAVQGTDSVVGRAAGAPAWYTTNTSRGAGGADPTLSGTNNGYPDAAATDGTVRALTETLLLGLLSDIYTAGGDPDMVMLGVPVKQAFSNYMFGSSARIATQYQEQGANPRGGVTVVGAVDLYISDFGKLQIVPNRFQRSRDVHVLESDMWAVSYLDSYHVEKMGKTGDNVKRVILVDWTLECRNEAASGIIADVDSSAAMTQ